MPTSYQVTATALNLRSAPGTDSPVLAVLRNGQVCLGAGDANGNWLPVSFGAQSGFVSATYVRALNGTAPAPNLAAPAGWVTASPPAMAGAVALPTDPEIRLRDFNQLHPRFREMLATLLQKLADEQRPFKVFEAFRTPERQLWLHAQGRTRPGNIVTKAPPWESFHQFGLAADLVLFVNGNWTWDDAGPLAAHWQRLRELAAEVGLRSLSFEAPHVELAVPLKDATGPDLVAVGDEGWFDTLSAAATRWRNDGHASAPDLPNPQRPAMSVPTD